MQSLAVDGPILSSVMRALDIAQLVGAVHAVSLAWRAAAVRCLATRRHVAIFYAQRPRVAFWLSVLARAVALEALQLQGITPLSLLRAVLRGPQAQQLRTLSVFTLLPPDPLDLDWPWTRGFASALPNLDSLTLSYASCAGLAQIGAQLPALRHLHVQQTLVYPESHPVPHCPLRPGAPPCLRLEWLCPCSTPHAAHLAACTQSFPALQQLELGALREERGLDAACTLLQLFRANCPALRFFSFQPRDGATLELLEFAAEHQLRLPRQLLFERGTRWLRCDLEQQRIATKGPLEKS